MEMIISSHRGECSSSSSSWSWSFWRSGDYPLDSLPPGYRFKPTDKEIFDHLHHKIIHGVSLMQNIRDVNLYDFHPQTLTEIHPPLGEKEWYFFTRRNRKYPKGSKPDRSAVNGYWKATAKENGVKYEGKEMANKRSLVFVDGDHQHGSKSSWMMHEYTVKKSHLPTTNHNPSVINDDDDILCRVYEKGGNVKEINPQQLHHHTSEALVVEAAEEVNKHIDDTNFINPAAGAEQFYNGNGVSARMDMGEDLMWTQTLLMNPPDPYLDQTVCNNSTSTVNPPQFYNGNGVSARMDMGEDLMWTQTLMNPPDPYLDQTVCNINSTSSVSVNYPPQFYNGGYFSSLLMMGEDCDPYLDQTLDYPAPTTQQFYNGSNQDLWTTLINPQNVPASLDQITVDCPAPAPAPAAEQFYSNVSAASMRMEEDLRTQINPQDFPVDQTVDECRNVNLAAAEFYSGSGSMINGEDLNAVGQECPPPLALDHRHLLHHPPSDSHLNTTPHYPDFSVSGCHVDDNLNLVSHF